MPLPSAQPTPRTALSALIAALALSGCSGAGPNLGLAMAHGPLRHWPGRGLDGPHPHAMPRPVEHAPKDWIDQAEGRALTRQMQGLIQAQARQQLICMVVAEPQDPAAADPCGGSSAGGLDHRRLKAARGDPRALRELARHCNALGCGSLAGMSGFASNLGGLASQDLWARVGGDLALYKLAAATSLLLLPTADAPDGQAILRASADRLPALNKALIALRQARPSLAHGSWERAVALGATLSVQRRLGAELTVLTYNYGPAAARLPLTGLPAGARLAALHPRIAAPLQADAQGRASVPLAAQSFAVWQVLGSATR